MKKKVITTVIAVMSIGCSAVYAGSMDESNVSSAAVGVESVAEESELSPEALLDQVSGTYDELFTVICDEQYDDLWLEDCRNLVGDEMAELSAEALKAACTGTIYGEEAVEAYGDNPDEAQFDCFFTNGVSQFVFDGSSISGLDENGEEVFSHEYEYVKDLSIGGMLDGYLYETADEDAGEFRYFFLLPDTPDTTYHIEFRYGSDEAALTEYAEGPYAYWLAAGIPADCDQEMIENVIGLFCEENLSGMDEADSAMEAADSAEEPAA